MSALLTRLGSGSNSKGIKRDLYVYKNKLMLPQAHEMGLGKFYESTSQLTYAQQS